MFMLLLCLIISMDIKQLVIDQLVFNREFELRPDSSVSDIKRF